MPTGKQRASGFTYIGVLIAVALFGLASVGAARLLASTERVEREAELLFVGHQFRQAIRSYLQAGQRAGQYPATLEDLLVDKRYPVPRRHLRRLFVDPITGKTDWGLVSAPEGGIMGVYSLSEREPLKRANFDPEDGDFAKALQPAQAASAAQASALSPLVPASSTLQLTPMDATPYSYRDWRFVYRPNQFGNQLTTTR
jgi:type II secretory pathway pseudopilin PulG